LFNVIQVREAVFWKEHEILGKDMLGHGLFRSNASVFLRTSAVKYGLLAEGIS
jgi:hypothetical protein